MAAEKGLINKDLRLIAENINVFIGKDKETKRILKHMDLEPSDISKGLERDIKKAQKILQDEKQDPVKRIGLAKEIVGKWYKDKDVPVKIRELILATALKRLDNAKGTLEWDESQTTAIKDAKEVSYTLDLFLKDDEETRKRLRLMGVGRVPDVVKKAAKEAQAVLEDKKLDAKERAMKAAEVLMAPITPVFVSKGVKDIDTAHSEALQHEIKCVLWEIAKDFTYGVAKVK